MIFTDAPVAVEWWTPYEKCWWDDDDSRVERIANEQALYFNFQPLSVNEATRWKRRQERLSQQEPIQLEENADDNLIRPAETEAAILAILNKLSWTNIDKLTPQFIEGLSVNKDQRIADLSISKPDSSVASATVSPSLVRSTMAIVVDKAMLEPHFAALYAKLTVNLSQCHKLFKKTVLSLCQEQFEATGREDSDRKTDDLVTAQTTESAATSNGNNLGQQKSLALLARKKSIGLMIFIGELYVMRLIKVEIMISCCERLLVPDDEEKLESFCKLMTTIGKRLYEQENEQKSVASSNGHTNSNSSASHLWKTVYGMAGKPQPNGQSVPNVVVPSTRIKFLLQALVELKENNWTQVRHEHEKAKTLSQIHAQVAAEAKRGPITKTASAVLKRAQSGGSLFQTTSGGTFSKGPDGTSDQSLQQSTVISSEHSDGFSTVPAKPIRDKLRRAKSEVSGSAAATLQYQQRMGAPFVSHMPCTLQQQQEQSPPVRMPYAMSAVAIHNYRPRLPSHSEDDFVVDSDPQPWDRDEVGDRTKTLLKEYFVNGNLREAMTLVDEMVLGGGIVPAADRVERGVAVVQTGVLMVMEMKDEQVGKFLQVISKCLDDQMLDPASLIVALSDPLDFLRDIEIDAPLAGRLLATIVASWLEKKVNDNGMTAIPSLEALIQQAPDGFCLGDARPAEFVAQILMQRSGEVTDAEYAVLAAVMNENETKEFPSAQDFFQSCSKR